MGQQNRQYVSDTIALDEDSFTDCTFKGCTLQYGGGDLELVRCKFDGGTVELVEGVSRDHSSARALLEAVQGPAGNELTLIG